MKARGGRFLLILGAGLAVMSFVVVYILMSRGTLLAPQQAASSVPTAVPYTNVVVVKSDVPAYTVLDASNVTLKEVEASTVMTDATSEVSAVYGKMTTAPLTGGQQVRDSVLTKSGFSNVLATGEKAYALAIPPRNAFGGALTEGDRVDVLWSVDIKMKYQVAPDGTIKESEELYRSTKTLLQDVKILRVINLDPPAPPKEGAGADAEVVSLRPGSTQTSAMYTPEAPHQQVLILGVTDQQAEVIKYASEKGIIDLTLRSSAVQRDAAGTEVVVDGKPVLGDHQVEQTTGINLETLITQYGVPTPDEAPPTP